MRIKSVEILNGDEVLAESVLTNEKVVLIPKGTALKADYVPLIQSLGMNESNRKISSLSRLYTNG